EDKRNQKHKIVMDQRERLFIDGVTEVISFDEETVICETDMGTLIIRGAQLHVEKLNLDQGQLVVVGEISGMEYGEEGMFAKNSGGFLSRLFK
ncbi:MAG: sporulation protein YabP, partial [Anaerotignaceae bacterium]